MENISYQDETLTVGLNYFLRQIPTAGLVIRDFVILEIDRVPVDTGIIIEVVGGGNVDADYLIPGNENYYVLYAER
ncbi:MAG: hypothetical protein FWF13_06905 [Acidobacteria bacterium]|nr:hypothetical protein [Acidobacteriota bacterium]